MQDGELHNMISTNMKELFSSSSQVAHHMMKSGVEGIVINVISLKDFAALNGLSNLDEMEQFMTDETTALSDRFKDHGIKIFSIANSTISWVRCISTLFLFNYEWIFLRLLT